MIDATQVKCGRLPTKHDPRTLRLARYLTSTLPPAPPEYDYTAKVPSWGMLANDTVGDCTVAAAGHEVMAWTAYATSLHLVTTEEVLAAYSAITGYDPANPDSDQGAYCLDVLKYWRATGIAGHKIGSFVAVDPDKPLEVMTALWLFGSVYLGLDLPVSAQSQAVWDVPEGGTVGDGAPGSWGGHAVCLQAYDADGAVIVTWGETRRVTWAFLKEYCSEAYAILSPDFLSGGKAPNGFSVDQLAADLAILSGAPSPAAPSYRAVPAPFPGMGVDTVARIDAAHASGLRVAGMKFAMRYLGSLTAAEMAGITGAGLLLSPICYPPQHSGWVPVASDGAARGKSAVTQAKAIGIPAGVTIWIDLEGCRGGAALTKAWCEAFAAELVAGGYQAGLYVGAAPGGLSSADLYALKHVTRYWESCSRGIPQPASRGWCLKQHYKPNQTCAGVIVDFNSVCNDFFGAVPMFVAAG